ncbi:MAG: ROK family protein [Chloroflexi bacterium]|nr:ROK family protein [Chloroflexota bacterium]
MTDYALSADLGGTQLRVALVDREGALHERHATDTLAQHGREAVVNNLVQALGHVAGMVDRASIVGIGVSMPGPIDPDDGTVYDPPNLPGWGIYSAKDRVEDALGMQASFANDASLGALAEHAYGAGRGHKDMIYLTVSTGIGGGIIIDGRLYGGHKGFAGELGHMTIDRKGRLCNCGNMGCLEALASGTAVARIANERLASGEDSVLSQYSRDNGGPVSASQVAAASSEGDLLARSIMDEAAVNLGIGIVSYMHIFDPEIIVIGGGMSHSLDQLLPGIEREIQDHAMAHQRERRPVVKSELGDDVSILGAAALAFDAFDRRDQD